jgi:hypothetical protein
LPKNNTLDKVIDNLKRYPFFANCIRALNGTHLLVVIKGGYRKQAPWRSRKGGLSQNVLVVVNFKINFIYILAGWEGSTHDCRVIDLAKRKGFEALLG